TAVATKPVKREAKPRAAKSTAKSVATVHDDASLGIDADSADLTSADLDSVEVEKVTIHVDLPEQPHVTPTEELAVAIDMVPVIDPGTTLDGSAKTTIITVAPDLTSVPSLATAPVPVIAPLDVEAPSAPLSLDVGAPLSRRARLNGETSTVPETAAMLTADRLVDEKLRKPAKPEGAWPEFVYAISFGLINIGDSPRVRERKALDARIAKTFEGGARFIPVLTRKGGVGKTTVSTLLGMAMAEARDDRVIAIDANP